MPKQKTSRAAAKRFKLTGKGKKKQLCNGNADIGRCRHLWIDSDCDYSGQCFGKSDRSGYCSCVGGILWKTAAEVCKGISEENKDEETLGIQAGETQMQ